MAKAKAKGIRVRDAFLDEAHVEITTPGGGTLNVSYRPSSFRMGQQEQIEKEVQERDDLRTEIRILGYMWARFLEERLISWDLLDDDGEPIPIEYQAIEQKVDPYIMRFVLMEVNDHFFQSATTGLRISNGSRPTEAAE